MEQTTWTDLDQANQRDGHYRRRMPGFYRRARQVEEQALIDRNLALEEWLSVPDWQQGRLRQALERFRAADAAYADARQRTNVMYNHWQRLIRWRNEPCTGTPDGNVCRHCTATARLADDDYEPQEEEG